MVAPAVALALEATLLRLKSALPSTLKTAVAAVALAPTEVVKDPDGMVFVSVPATELVTTTETEQLDPAGITVPAARVKVPNPTEAVAVPRHDV